MQAFFKKISFNYVAFYLLNDFKKEFKNISIDKFLSKESIDKLLADNAELVLSNEPAKLGDTVVLDFKGYIDGKEFEGGSADNYSLVLGSNSFVPGFEEQLVGVSAETKKDVLITFPEQYVKDLAGKPAKFVCMIHEVKTKVVPELNDEFVETLNIANVKTVEDLKKHQKNKLFNEKVRNAESDYLQRLINKICENSEVVIGEKVLEAEAKNTVEKTKQQVEQNGLTFEQYLQILGLTEENVTSKDGISTGIDYIADMGVTHVQIMPSYDFASIDEAAPKKREYNWGYDPLNYNVPEGSFSTDPFHGEVRIREMKEMIAAFHREGIGVIMDVVYNHTYDLDSCLQKCEPDYYYRMNGTRYSNASACGNEIASEQPMMRKYIVESVCYWAREYHMDGFRFDLMGVLDIDTMNEISRRLKEINPHIILYGEGWTGGTSIMPEFRRAMKRNARMLDGIGMFSDDIRDMVRGHVFYNKDCGYVSGKEKMKVAVRYCAAGGVWHPQVDYASYTYAAGGTWTDTPEKVINYVSCHDNLTLWDKLQISRPDCDAGERLAMNRLAAAMVFTAQGVPFFLGGEEFARTKPAGNNGEVSENSYNLPYETNVLRYDWSDGQKGLQQYYRGLIAFRKAHKGLRMTDAEEIRQNILFMEMTSEQTIAFIIRQTEETLLVAYNASGRKETLLLPDDRTWTLYIDDLHAGTRPIGSVHSNMELPATGCVVLGINELSC